MFELAVGFLNMEAATQTNFLRGTGFNSPNLVEFAYFPDTGFGATISPTIISTNHDWAASFNFPLELTLNDLFRVQMVYAASNQTLRTVVTRNGQGFGPLEDVVIAPPFTDFRLDAVSICSYSDAGQDPLWGGSILARGVVDNLVVTTPPPPIQTVTGTLSEGLWRVEFDSRTNWLYRLETTSDFTKWILVNSAPGTGGRMAMQDQETQDARFYRVVADRP